MDDKIRLYQFLAAILFIIIGLGYCFILVWLKPVTDLSSPIFGLIMLLIGYYWGTSKSSADKDRSGKQGITGI